jgi:hypothetical protein
MRLLRLAVPLLAILGWVAPPAAVASAPPDLGSPPPTCEAAHLDYTDSSCTVDTRYGRFRISPSIVHAGRKLTGVAGPGEMGCGIGGVVPCGVSWSGFLGMFPDAPHTGCGPTVPATCTITVPKTTPTTRYTTSSIVIEGGISRSYFAVLGEGDYLLSGHVTDPDGKPVARLRLLIRGHGVSMRRTTDASGGYRAALHRGRYTVVAVGVRLKPQRSAGCRPSGGTCIVALTRDRTADFIRPTACDNPKPFSLPDVPTKTDIVRHRVVYNRTVRVSTQDCLLMHAQWTLGSAISRGEFLGNVMAKLSVDGRSVDYTWLELEDTPGLTDLVWPQFPLSAGRHTVDLHVEYDGTSASYQGVYKLHVVLDAQGGPPPANSGKPPCRAVAVSGSGAHIEGPSPPGDDSCEPWGQRVTDTIGPASALDDTPDCESGTAAGGCLGPGALVGQFDRDIRGSNARTHHVAIVLPYGSDHWHALRTRENLHVGDVIWGSAYAFHLFADRGHTWTIIGGPVALAGPTEFQPMRPSGPRGVHARILGPRGGEIVWRRDVGTFTGEGTLLLVLRRGTAEPLVTSLLPAGVNIDRGGPR